MKPDTAEHWDRKAARARDAAAKMVSENARSIMLEIADYYEQRAREVQAAEAQKPNSMHTGGRSALLNPQPARHPPVGTRQ